MAVGISRATSMAKVGPERATHLACGAFSARTPHMVRPVSGRGGRTARTRAGVWGCGSELVVGWEGGNSRRYRLALVTAAVNRTVHVVWPGVEARFFRFMRVSVPARRRLILALCL